MRFTPKKELDSRCLKLQEAMRNQGIDSALIVQNADLFYFAGTVQRSHLYVPAEGEPLLMVTRSFERACRESALTNIIRLENPKALPRVLDEFGYQLAGNMGLELDILPTNNYLRYAKLFAPAVLTDISPCIRNVRMVKSDYELDILRDVASRHREILFFIKKIARPEMTEIQLAGLIEAECRRKGHPGTLRARGFNQNLIYVLVSSGENLAIPTYLNAPIGGLGVSPAYPNSAADKVIGRNTPFLVDFDFVYDGYALDQTRLFCFGNLPPRLEDAYRCTQEIQRGLKEAAKPGVTCEKLYRLAVELAAKTPYSDYFMSSLPFVGHGVGIEADEWPVVAPGFRTPLAEGMVLALEPKFVFPESAVGLEDTFIVRANGLEALTTFDEEIQYLD